MEKAVAKAMSVAVSSVPRRRSLSDAILSCADQRYHNRCSLPLTLWFSKSTYHSRASSAASNGGVCPSEDHNPSCDLCIGQNCLTHRHLSYCQLSGLHPLLHHAPFVRGCCQVTLLPNRPFRLPLFRSPPAIGLQLTRTKFTQIGQMSKRKQTTKPSVEKAEVQDEAGVDIPSKVFRVASAETLSEHSSTPEASAVIGESAPEGSEEKQNDVHPNSELDRWKELKLCGRCWMPTEGATELETGTQLQGAEFTVATYNVLAQNLLEDNSYLYTHARKDWLEWSYRQKNLLEEIKHHSPDILCCQEINVSHYEEFFLPEMEKLGYQGAFKKRTRYMFDGCATFFKTSTFECDAVVPVEYLKPGVTVLDRDNVALLLLLRPKHGLEAGPDAPKLCVANTHLLFNPRRGDVKLAQLMKLFAEIDRLAFRGTAKSGIGSSSYHPVLLCGDLNMEPFSELYRFVSQGYLSVYGLLPRNLSGQERSWTAGGEKPLQPTFLDRSAGITDRCQYVDVRNERSGVKSSANNTCNKKPSVMKVLSSDQCSGNISHGLNLKSVYRHIIFNGRRPGKHGVREVTTSHTRANSTVDYIFYSDGDNPVDFGAYTSGTDMVGCPSVDDARLKLLARLELVSDRDMEQIGGLPNEFISSDHLILAAKFLLRSK